MTETTATNGSLLKEQVASLLVQPLAQRIVALICGFLNIMFLLFCLLSLPNFASGGQGDGEVGRDAGRVRGASAVEEPVGAAVAQTKTAAR